MSYIKFNLVKMDKSLVFQILNQNLRKTPNYDRYGNYGNWDGLKMDIDGYDVSFKRSNHPEIKVDTNHKILEIYGRGDNSSKHLDPQVIYFEDNFDRDEIFNILVKGLQTVSEKVK